MSPLKMLPLVALLMAGCQSTKFEEVAIERPEIALPPVSVVFGGRSPNERLHTSDLEKHLIEKLRASEVFSFVYHENPACAVTLHMRYSFERINSDTEQVGKAVLAASTLGMVPTSFPYRAELLVDVQRGSDYKSYVYTAEGKDVYSIANMEMNNNAFDALLASFLDEALRDGVLE